MNTLTTFKQKKDTQGFTLIELMIAIAIVGILAAVAVPQFTDYLGRARVSEAINLAQGCKTGFVEHNATRGAFPANAVASGCANISTENVDSVVVSDSAAATAIVVTLKNASPVPPDVRGHRIILQPLASPSAFATSGGPIAGWRCAIGPAGTATTAASDAAKKMVPTGCQQDITLPAAPAAS